MLEKIAPEAKLLASAPWVALRELFRALGQRAATEASVSQAGEKVLFDKDGNPTLNLHNPEVRQAIQAHLEKLAGSGTPRNEP